MRHDGFLYTGTNSSTRNKASVREQVKKRKEEVQLQLAPAAELIFGRIEAEKNQLGELLAGLVDSTQSPSEVQAHIEGIKLYRDYLVRLEQRFKADLRQGRVQEQADMEFGDE